MPLHVENVSRGGNEIAVCWHKACHHNLHSVWDTTIPETIAGFKPHDDEKAAAEAWAESLAGGKSQKADPQATASLLAAECSQVAQPDSCSLIWAREANNFVCTYVLKNGISWFHNKDLSTNYYDGAAPVVEYLIGKAGVRLAGWLEAMVAVSQEAQRALPANGQQVLNKDL